MKIVIFGASGKTGSLLIDKALADGHLVTAYMRKAGAFVPDHPNLKIVIGNLDETLRLRDAITGADACISALGGGSRSQHAPEIIEGIDRIVSTMEVEGVDRFIYLSALGAGNSRYYIPQPVRFIVMNIWLKAPMTDHTINEERIHNSHLKWTIVRPGLLSEQNKTDHYHHGFQKIKLKSTPKISRANVADFMLQQLTQSEYIHRCTWLYE